MYFPEPVDRNVSSFLNINDFINVRKTCRQYYYDEEAYHVRAWSMPFHISDFDARKTIAIHYLMSYALQFEERLGSVVWYQRIVNWLKYKSSIKMMYTFICIQKNDFLFKMDLSNLSLKQRFVWLRLFHCNQRVQNQRLYKYDYLHENEHLSCDFEQRPAKRQRCWLPSYGDLQPCC
jgi:hypothetical protein